MSDEPINRHLSRAQHNLLVRIRDSQYGELVYERGAGWWVDCDRVSGRTVTGLLLLCLISKEDFGNDALERYELNEDGRGVLEDTDYVPRILLRRVKH